MTDTDLSNCAGSITVFASHSIIAMKNRHMPLKNRQKPPNPFNYSSPAQKWFLVYCLAAKPPNNTQAFFFIMIAVIVTKLTVVKNGKMWIIDIIYK
jgi:hypothetical protein